MLIPVTSFLLKGNSAGVILNLFKILCSIKSCLYVWRLEIKEQSMYQFQLQETENSTKSGLSNKEHLLHHISQILL